MPPSVLVRPSGSTYFHYTLGYRSEYNYFLVLIFFHFQNTIILKLFTFCGYATSLFTNIYSRYSTKGMRIWSHLSVYYVMCIVSLLHLIRIIILKKNEQQAYFLLIIAKVESIKLSRKVILFLSDPRII